MSNSATFIVDTPLPIDQNFSALKSDGLDMIKALAGKKWSNYNESDPGVTILDQLCYALTELGYCAQFPIADVLTRADGKINYQDQFFEPQDILTCSPITVDDYRKMVVDQVPEVKNIYIDVERTKDNNVTGSYTSTIFFNPESILSNTESNDKLKKLVIAKVMRLLMRNRNLTEIFQTPRILNTKGILLNGTVLLDKTASAQKVYSQILQVLADYVSPLVNQSGYQELIADGQSADEIFNGPKLDNGWMGDDNPLGDKCTSVRLIDIASLITKIDGVLGLDGLSLSLSATPSKTEDPITILGPEIAQILPSSTFKISQNAVVIEPELDQQVDLYLRKLKADHQAASINASIDLTPALPTGLYRDIEQYYSVQNTFPDIYAIGPNSLQSDSPSYRVAQSRQLKGYLMIYDQLLANQFSQLAHVGDLFSFQDTYQEADQWLTANPNITYKKFSTTYYFQPLYGIPDVKPLLRGNDSFNYKYDATRQEKLVERDAWKKYCKDPFNQYIYQLRQHIESDQESESRRDHMLTHLMARQGEDGAEYDDMINTCHWYGSDAKSRIIVKSIWLQNNQLLSYYRTSAYHCNEASALSRPGRYSITKTDFAELATVLQNTPIPKLLSKLIGPAHSDKEDLRQAIADLLISKKMSAGAIVGLLKKIPISDQNKALKDLWEQKTYPPTIDGQLDQRRVFAEAKLLHSDVDNYSTFELKLNILLGLRHFLLPIAGQLVALLANEDFLAWLSSATPTSNNTFLLPDTDISVKRESNVDRLREGENNVMDIVWPKDPNGASEATTGQSQNGQTKSTPQTVTRIKPDEAVYQAHADQLTWLGNQRMGLLLIEHVLLLESNDVLSTAPAPYLLNATVLFPGYISLFQQDNFKTFVDTLIELHWPAHVDVTPLYPSFSGFSQLVDNFVPWHNGLIAGKGLAPSMFPNQMIPIDPIISWPTAAKNLATLLKLPKITDPSTEASTTSTTSTSTATSSKDTSTTKKKTKNLTRPLSAKNKTGGSSNAN